MKDIQNQCDSRRINIRKVGIRGLSYQEAFSLQALRWRIDES